MLRAIKDFENFTLRASDGEIGKAKEFYFDDADWAVRYLVVSTGGWLTGNRVLISPYALEPINEIDCFLPVNLTKKQIEESPLLGSDEPVSRQFEERYSSYYGSPMYWNGPYMWGPMLYPGYSYGSNEIIAAPTELYQSSGDAHLRSSQEVTGYHIQAIDGEIGHIEDFIVDDREWAIRYLIVDTTNWWPGKRVLIAPQWIKSISWAESKIFINMTRADIEKSPEYAPDNLNRDYEKLLYSHYHHNGYWTDEHPIVSLSEAKTRRQGEAPMEPRP